MPGDDKQKPFNIVIGGVLSIMPSAVSGFVPTFVFHPPDRALFLSMKYNRNFLDSANFQQPYQGFRQIVIQKTVSHGIYFFIQKHVQNTYSLYAQNANIKNDAFLAPFVIGVGTGGILTVLTHPFTAIKYRTFADGKRNTSFSNVCYEMTSQGGLKSFSTAGLTNLVRNILFGSTYEEVRALLFYQATGSEKRTELSVTSVVCDTVAGGVAAGVTCLPNYIRNKKFSAPLTEPTPKMSTILYNTWRDTISKPELANSSLPAKVSHVAFKKFQVGWGAALVAGGMALGQLTSDVANNHLEEALASIKTKLR